MKWIYLSPHFDDAVLSCGGLIWKQVQDGDEVEVWTIFGGDPKPSELSFFAQVLHHQWNIPKDSVEIRRDEDKQALELLGASYRHYDYLDCIYRKDSKTGQYLYEDMQMITGKIDKKEVGLRSEIKQELSELKTADAQIISPFGIGYHIDHRMIQDISSTLRIDMMYYLDFPYVFTGENPDTEGKLLKFDFCLHEISDVGRTKWKESIAKYKSQISSFWANSSEMEKAIEKYYKNLGGIKLYFKK